MSASARWVWFLMVGVALAGCDRVRDDTDGFLPDPECGNGRVEQGEECDDADADDTDLCLSSCVLASCGDGLLFATTEECDDGAANADTAACRSDCTAQSCGDGDVGPGEECDDGNDVDTDACRDCEIAGCGDGVKTPTEECDDHNDDGGDGCTAACLVEPGWVCDGACTCAAGYTGDDCGTCTPGYQDADGDGSCLPDCALSAALGDTCDPTVSYCLIEAGAPSCVCYDGLFDQGAGCAPPPICRVYVDLDATGDGSGGTWADAKTNLQVGIDVAAGLAEGTLDHRCEVWATAGTYSVFVSAEADTLLLRPGVTVRGGFAGTEATLDERAIDATTGFMEHESVLDGGGWCTHVVTGASGATLDGFVVTGGNASGHRDNATGRGGGLYAAGADDLLVSNTTFRDNTAKSGGAVALVGGSATLSGVRFTDNTADWDGGAVFAVDYGSLDVVDSWFGQNHNDNGWGGALYSFGPGLLTVDGTTFADNASRWDAGGLFHAGSGVVTFVSTRFADNNSTEWEGCIGGGALVRGITQVDVDQGRAAATAPLSAFVSVYADFVGNSVPYEGGGLYLRDVAFASFVGGEFKGNIAGRGPDFATSGGHGGGIVAHDLGVVSFAGTSFVGNEANWKGGGAAFLGALSLSFDATTFDGNVTLTGEGGGFVAEDVVGDVVLRDVVFTDNESATTGGGAHLDGFAHLAIDGGAFLDNGTDSHNSGGALFAHGDLDSSTVAIDGTVFDDNYSRGAGSAFAGSYLDDVEIKRASFRRNEAPTDAHASGLAVHLRWARSVRVLDTDFDGNARTRSWGAGALWLTNFEDVTIDGSTFHDSAPVSLGSTTGAVMLCNDSSPTWSPSAGYCNAPYWNYEDSDAGVDFEATATITDSSFADNGAAGNGSHLTGRFLDALTIDGVSFESGYAEYGADVWVEESGDVTLRDVSFDGSRGRNTGSAFVMKGGNSGTLPPQALVIDGASFEDSSNAPPVRVEKVESVEIRHATFEGPGVHDPSATCSSPPDYDVNGGNMGGAVHVDFFDSVVVEDSSFTGYRAQAGGALGLDNGAAAATVAVRRTSFTETQSKYAGGALHVRSGATAALEELTFTDTIALCGGGGALHVEGFDVVTLSDSSFTDYGSTFDSGAAHIVYNDDVTVQDVTFTQSKGMTHVAGAMLVDGGKAGSANEFVLEHVVVEGASTTSTGGAVKLGQVDSVHVSDSVFDANACDRQTHNLGAGWCLGTGLYVQSAGDVLVERSVFLDNAAVSDGADEGQVGAGLAADAVHTLTVRSSLFAGNSLVTGAIGGNRGAAIDFRPKVWNSRVDPLALSVQGSTLVDNSSMFAPAVSIDRVYVGDGPAIDTEVVNTIARDASADPIVSWGGNAAVVSGVPVAITYSNVSFGAGGTNVDVAPEFGVSGPADEYGQWRPVPTSPMVGAGIALAEDPVDLEGTTRPSPPSMGALEQ